MTPNQHLNSFGENYLDVVRLIADRWDDVQYRTKVMDFLESDEANNYSLDDLKDVVCHGLLYGTILAEYFKENNTRPENQKKIIEGGFERLRALDADSLKMTISDRFLFLATLLEQDLNKPRTDKTD